MYNLKTTTDFKESLFDFQKSLIYRDTVMKRYNASETDFFRKSFINLSEALKHHNYEKARHLRDVADDTLDFFFYGKDLTGGIIQILIDNFEHIKNERSAYDVFNYLCKVRVSASTGRQL